MKFPLPPLLRGAVHPVLRLTFLYVAALSLVAVLLLGSQAVVQYQLRGQSQDAATINLAGRQRALSQRLSKIVLLLGETGGSKKAGVFDAGTLFALHGELRDTLALFQRAQAGLQRGDASLGLAGRPSPETQRLFALIDSDYRVLCAAAARFSQDAGREIPSPEKLREERTDVLESGENFFWGMDRIVLQLQKEAVRRVERLQAVEIGLCALALLVLLAEGMLVFRPAMRRLREAVDELVRAREGYRLIVEEAAEGIWQVSPEGRILGANAAMARLAGYGEEHSLAENVRDVGAQFYADPGRHVQLAALVEARGALYSEESEVRRRDGSTIWIAESKRAVRDAGGKLLYYEGALVNITRRKKAEEELGRALKQLIDLNREKDEFMGIAAHDLRSPLSAVMGYAELILEDKGMRRGEIDAHCGVIVQQTCRMADLVNRLLDANKIESGRIEVVLGMHDLVALVRSVVETYAPKAGEKNQRLLFDAPHQAVPILTDAGICLQVVDNLVSNAIKYSPPGKTVRVRVRLAFSRVYCEVEDEGPGIGPEDRKKLFCKFARLTARPTGGESSTGLGLSIVKRLAEAISADVRCESEVGKGSIFLVEFQAERS